MEQAEIILLPGRSCLVAQPLAGEAVDVADIAVGGLVDGRIGRVDDAVAEGDGDRIAVKLVDGLQALLEVARDGLGGGAVLRACLAAQDGESRVPEARDDGILSRMCAQDVRLLADERAQEGRAIRLLDLLVEAALSRRISA